MGDMFTHDWLWVFIGLLFRILVIAGLILIIWALFGRKKGAERSALEILKERYAKGEITKEEFDEKRKDILGDR
jgi:putative membrane protein